MKINYDYYYKNNFIIPLLLSIFLVIFMGLNIFMLLKKSDIKSRSYYIFTILVSVLVIVMLTAQLYRGFNLIVEKESDADVISGEITDIQLVYNSPRYSLNSEACHAVWLFIGDQRYYILDTDEISIGDKVQLTYLPRSRFVIEYYKE